MKQGLPLRVYTAQPGVCVPLEAPPTSALGVKEKHIAGPVDTFKRFKREERKRGRENKYLRVCLSFLSTSWKTTTISRQTGIKARPVIL